jgi:Carboxypeptidase regulatory-like domain/TonB dependent receptor-like, beta-barrel
VLRISLLAVLGVSLYAQTGVAPGRLVIDGTVKFGGQPIPGATVIATQGSRRQVTTTDESGQYEFSDLTSGSCNLEVQMFGFQTAHKQLQIGPGAPATEWTLELPPRPRELAQRPQRQQPAGFRAAAESEVDQIAAAPPPEDNTPQTTASANEAFLVNGSLSGGLQNGQNDFGLRGPVMEMQLPPGGVPGLGADGQPGEGPAGVPGGPGAGGPGGGRFGGGGFGRGRGFGGGRGGFGGPGGRRRNRPGGNGRFFGNRANRGRQGIHGNLSLQWRGDSTDAKPFSLSGQPVPEPNFNNYRWSAVLGGPLRIPHVLKGDSTFFMLSYFATRGQSPFYNVGTVPTLAERGGDFSQAFVNGAAPTIYNPSTAAPFSGNVIPASLLNPAAIGLLQYIPAPNLPGTVQNFEYVTAIPADTDNVSLRLNQNVGKNDRLALNERFQRRKTETAQLFGFLDPGNGFGDSTDLSWTHNVGANAVNTAHLTFNRNRTTQDSYFSFGPNIAAELGINGTSQEAINFGPPTVSFTNFASLTDALPSNSVVQSLGESESFAWVKKDHTLTFGGDYKRYDRNIITDQNARGTFQFSGLATSAFTASGQPVVNTGFDFADFLLGLPQSSSVQFGNRSTYFRQNAWDLFANDDWRVNPKLTLMFGVRYEYYSPLSEKYGHIANLDIAPGFSAVASVLPGIVGPYSGAFPGSLIEPDRNNWAPRGGLAWKPSAKHSTVVRVGYGIYYNPTALNRLASELSQQPPFGEAQTLTTSTANVLTLQNGLATAPTNATILNTYAVQKNYKVGYAQSWNVSLQQNLSRSFFIELSYIGTKGTDLDTQTVPNRALPGSPLTSQERLQIGNAQQFIYDSSWGNSIYHAGQVRLMRRFSRNMSFNVIYTYSKSIDDSSTFGGVGNVVAQNAFDLSAERGLSSFDRRHALSLNYVLSTPTQASWWKRNWTLSGSASIQSGTPLTARILGNQSNVAGTGVVGSGRAEATGLPVADGSGYFNLDAFTFPPAGELGDAGRNTIPGPWSWSLNTAFGRYFTLGGEGSRKRIELRMETNNTLNHVNITNVNTVFGSANYGLPTTAGAMRSVNLNIRFRF